MNKIDAESVWLRAHQSAPYASEITKMPTTGALCWPDGYPKDDTSRMLVWLGTEWVSLSEEWSRIFK